MGSSRGKPREDHLGRLVGTVTGVGLGHGENGTSRTRARAIARVVLSHVSPGGKLHLGHLSGWARIWIWSRLQEVLGTNCFGAWNSCLRGHRPQGIPEASCAGVGLGPEVH